MADFEGFKLCSECKTEKACAFLKQCERCGELKCNFCIRETGTGAQAGGSA